ncbi:jacalin-related lectin 3-like [Musa acuminata AAA Group]|uniref:jacalin-related lectin 3-like n=1 Tax=Musa acuminata AAA Group TaxID=214697 RepID=UPI0031D8AA4C
MNTPLSIHPLSPHRVECVCISSGVKGVPSFNSSLMASNQIKTAAHARGGVPKCPCGNESRWAMEPADKITGISIGAASCVNSIKITFDIDGTTRVTPRYGGPGGELFQFTLMQDEYLTSVSGYVKHDCSEFPCVSQLTFTTNLAKTYGPYGGGGGTFFEVNVEYDEIKGFFGHATEEYLTAFGVYVMLA